jgi:hypothetical protein
MSAAYYLVFDKEPAGFDPFVNGKALAQAGEQLTAIAAATGVTPLSEFVSFSEREQESFDLSDGEFAMLPRDRWFAPTEIKKTVAALFNALQADPKGVPNAAAVIVTWPSTTPF